jgi:hypothetical protein
MMVNTVGFFFLKFHNLCLYRPGSVVGEFAQELCRYCSASFNR